MNRLLRVICICIISNISFSQTALIEIPFTFSDGVGGSAVRIVGLDPSATDGIDASLGEALAPPKPPQSNIFDVRFILPSTDETLKDIREGDNTSASIGDRVYTVNYQLGAGSTGLQVSWDLPTGVGLNLKDFFGGVILNETFSAGPGSYTITTYLANFYLTVQYLEAPFPVELTSFVGRLLDETVILKWETATEVNNYGFEIERKTDSNEWNRIGFAQGYGNSNSPKSYQFYDNNLIGGVKLYYRLKQIENDGQYEYSDIVEINLEPDGFILSQNYPNPFNPNTVIKYQLPKESKVVINIYNMLGAEVMELMNDRKEAGIYEVEFKADNLTTGTYIYQIITENFVETKKMILLK